MERTVLVTLTFVLLIASTLQATELRPYIAHGKENLICFECPAGFYLSGNCNRNNTIATCTVCPLGYYSSVPGVHTNCARCAQFCESDTLIVVSNCSSTNNLTCDCPPGKELTNPLDKYRAVCEDPPTPDPPEIKQNCSCESARTYNESSHNQTQDDSVISEDVGHINLTNCTCPAHDKCVDGTYGFSHLHPVFLVFLIVFSIFFIQCIIEICKRQGSEKCKGTDNDSVSGPENVGLLKMKGDPANVSNEETSPREDMDSISNDEQNSTDGSELMQSIAAHLCQVQPLNDGPTPTVPSSVIYFSAATSDSSAIGN